MLLYAYFLFLFSYTVEVKNYIININRRGKSTKYPKNEDKSEGKIVIFMKMEKNAKKKSSFIRKIKRDKWLYIFLLPILIYYIVFCYLPMGGVLIAFQDFKFSTGFFHSEWVGLKHFQRMFGNGNFFNIFRNTLMLNVGLLVFGFPVPIILAILLNEINNKAFKKISQSIMYLPHFMSWIVVGGILIEMLSPSTGIINTILQNLFHIEPIYFLGDKKWWVVTFIISDIWKGAGWGTIIYLAAISGIDQQLYEAAKIDGAGKWAQMRYITFPGIKSTVIVMLVLRMGSMMNIGFEQIYALKNPAVLDVAEVISTYVYSLGITGAQYSYSTAIGLFQSVINCILVFSTNKISRKMNGEGLW